MSGIFGISDPTRQLDLTTLTDKMGAIMSHRDWFVAERLVEPEQGLALGRIGIGIFNALPQPIWNAAGTIALVMAGEFYNQATLRQNGAETSHSDEELALTLYERFGPDFVKSVNGVFVIAIWDRNRNQLVIVNDRFGLYPLYYTHQNDRFFFAPEMKAILAESTFSRHLDMVALAQYMRFQHLLGDRTFFKDIKLLPGGTILTLQLGSGSCQQEQYWSYADIPSRPYVSFNEAVEEAGRLLRRAVQRLSGDSYRPGVYLSGGLDSRTILGLVERRPIVSLTYGARNCRDVVYARQIADKVGSDHHWFDLPNGEWVKQYADFHLELTEGFHSWIHAHGISTLTGARQLMDVNLTGWDGGTIMGHRDSIEPLQIGAVDEAALTTRLFYLFNQKYTWPSITEAEENFLYCPGVAREQQGVAFDSFRTELAHYTGYRPDVRGEYFYIENHCKRLTHNFVTFTRSHIEVRFPFFDYDLIDFLYSLPATVRGHQLLYRALIQQETPELAYIPYDHDEFLPTTRPLPRNSHSLLVRLKRFLNNRLRRMFFLELHTLYADYEVYLRRELRPWAEELLFDPRTQERALFDPAFVRTLMARHQSNYEEWTIGKIAPIMSYEMMLRRFYD